MRSKQERFEGVWDSILDKAIDTASTNSSQFKIEPISPKEFFETWLKQPLFPEQYRIINQIFTKDYKNWRTNIKEILLLWGEGASKDYTIVRTLAYCCYWLCCLRNPQEYFHIGANTPIVVACMSVNEEHAKDVFFKQFTTVIKDIRNPATGRNFFADLGVDLRDNKDIQTRKVLFPNHIEALSADASRYGVEGKNVLMCIFDEIAEVRYDRAKERYNNAKNTAFSRFKDHYKLVMISYPRDEFDYMMTHYHEVDEWPEEDKKQVFKSRKAPWEVRAKEGAHPDLIKKHLYKLKEDYIPMYRSDPDEAKRRYECMFTDISNTRFLKKFSLVLERCINFNRPSPIVWDDIGREQKVYVTEKELLDLTWQPWFRPNYSYKAYEIEQKLQKLLKNPEEIPKEEVKEEASEEAKLKEALEAELVRHENAQYFIHIDLSQGIKDCAGLVVVHSYSITPTQIGYYVDLAIQIRPEDAEIDFETVRKFVFKLSDKGFDIVTTSLDGFQSVEFRQQLEKRGIQSELISMDRSKKPYDTLKSLLYQGKVDIYSYLVILRELKELQNTSRGKVDHPQKSPQRLKEEGLKDGSKDVADALAGAIYAAILQELDIGPALVDPSDNELPDPEDISKRLGR